ncbi:sucrose-6-phosphate hydrolase [Carnobacteriaceae bacterium 52-44]
MDSEKRKIDVQNDNWRLNFHVMPETGWLNDPNGAIQFDGQYHIYYQYVPETPLGGATHWGHMTSKDMVNFKQEPIFMSPDQTFDVDGVYSGSGIEKDGKLHFFYTGNVKQPGDYDYIYSGREQNVVHVVSKDGFEIERREVVIPHADFPEGFTDHIRDPKLLEKDGIYYMVLGARTEDNLGSVLVYKSDDLEDWTYHGTLLDGNEDQGYMWECPDFFELDDASVLIFSPQGILPEEYKYNNPHVAGYLIGETDWEEVKLKPEETFYEFDRGFDFYAPHTFEDDQGRRIMWSWMGVGDIMPEYTNPTIARGWQHAMALPRELVLENGQIFQRPLDEYKQLRKNEQSRSFSEAEDLAGEVYELFLEFQTSDAFELKLRQDTELIYDGEILTLKHGKSGYGRRKRMTPISEIRQLQIFVDTSSMEIFVNDGEFVLTTRVYPEAGEDTIEIETKAEGTITYWDLI